MSQAEVDGLRLDQMESQAKADHLLEQVRALGHDFSVILGDQVFVNIAWLGTLMLWEADQTLKGHGGCADHMRVLDLLETTILAARKNVGLELDSPGSSVLD